MEQEGLLAPYRILDLTDEKGYICGKILGDLGAEVMKVEPPGGDKGRRKGPFYKDEPCHEGSLFWNAFNVNKKGITLNVSSTEGRSIFEKLVKKFDVVIESFPPGYMDGLDLGYEEISKINPDLIYASITPFGEEGPYKDYKATDIVVMALSGYMYLNGDTDRAPVTFSFPQAFLLAGATAATGIIVALYHRNWTGEGQKVDVSAQECMCWAMMQAQQYWDLLEMICTRSGPYWHAYMAGTKSRLNWKCKDGYVTFLMFGGQVGARFMQRFMEWMDEEGKGEPFLKDIDWYWAFHYAGASQELTDRVSEPVARFFSAYTKDELYKGARERGIQLYPVSTVEDIAKNEQLKARGFWTNVDFPGAEVPVTFPGSFVKTSHSPPAIKRRAPLVGEHNEEIFVSELGFSREEMLLLYDKGTI